MPVQRAEASKTILIREIIVTLDPLPTRVLTETLVHFKGRVTSNGVGVEGADVHIWHAASGTDIASDYSGVDGYFDVPWWIPFTVGSGAWLTTLPCASHEFYAWTLYAEQSNRQSMEVAYRARIRGLASVDYSMPGVAFPVTGYLEYESASGVWSGVAGKRIDVTYNDTPFGSDPSTDADGGFMVLSDIPTSGTYTLTASFAGAGALGAATAALPTTSQAFVPPPWLEQAAALVAACVPVLAVAGVLGAQEARKLKIF